MKHTKWIYVIVILLSTKISCLYAKPLSEHEMQIQEEVIQQKEEAVETLARLVNINSGTMNFKGVKQVADQVEKELQKMNFDTRWVDLTEIGRAGYLFALHNGGSGGKRILLLGHLDTVFEERSSFQSFERVEDIAYGPGVQDMKGGITVMLYALKALQATGDLEDANIIVALTGDEENSLQPFEKTRAPLMTAAQNSDYALSFEGSSNLNEAIIALRGISYWELKTNAKGGHSSKISSTEFGNGAILEMVHILDEFEQLTKKETNLTFNPGILIGGFDGEINHDRNTGSTFGKRNLIAKDSVAEGEIRYLNEAQCQRIQRAMTAVVEKTSPHTSAKIEFSACKPTMVPTQENDALLLRLNDINQTLGYGSVEQIEPIGTWATDISFISRFLPSIEGLGALGRGAHTKNEQINLPELNVATQRSAILIYRLMNG